MFWSILYFFIFTRQTIKRVNNDTIKDVTSSKLRVVEDHVISKAPNDPNVERIIISMMILAFLVCGCSSKFSQMSETNDKSYKEAFHDSNWQLAMCDEYYALIKNNTWTLVPQPADVNIVRSMWLFWHKYLADGHLGRYKARVVANGNTQLSRIDVDETFSPVVKPATIQTVLSLVVSRHWLRSLYGLKQAPRAWFQRSGAYITRVGFSYSRCDSSLFIYRQGTHTAYLLLYVDDIVLIASSTTLLQQVIGSLHQEFSMTGLGSLTYFLGIFVTRTSSRMFLSQHKYVAEILERAHMVSCNSSWTLVDTDIKLGAEEDLVADPTLYCSLAGALQYLTFTRLNISYDV
ncbi:ribonuclease H-like domain-containing protein [Tanacetum coccineum]